MYSTFYLIIILSSGTIGKEINVCKSYLDYFIKVFPGKCYHNEDVDTDMPTLVEQHAIELKSYDVITEDGYILKVYRIPTENVSDKKGVVYLQHPATASCTVWVDKGNKSLAYILQKQGYDVWLGNFRGSYYSRNHSTFDPNAERYWDFTYHEMGVYDLPAIIELIKDVTKTEKLSFVGHSMSANAAAVYASLKPQQAAENINGFVLMAPSIYLKKLRTPFRHLAPYHRLIHNVLKVFGYDEMIPRTKFTRKIMKLCYTPPFIKLCTLAAQIFMGFAWDQIDPELIPLTFSQSPAGVSLKSVEHLTQSIVNDGNFVAFDYYDEDKNLLKYGTKTPLRYPVENITTPMYLMYGSNDDLVTKEAAVTFFNDLNEKARYREVDEIKGFNHFNFLYAKDIEAVYAKVVGVINEFNKNV